jgi:hypothetical protein
MPVADMRERVRVAVAVDDSGAPSVVRMLEPDVELARTLDDEAARLCADPDVNGTRRRAAALYAFADVYRAAAAAQRRFPGQLEL